MRAKTQLDVSVTHRPIKYARLRVREDASIELIAPLNFSKSQIDAVLEKKADWIQHNQQLFHLRQTKSQLGKGELLLLGQVFRFDLTTRLGRRVIIDQSERLIQTGLNLDDPRTRDLWYRRVAHTHLKGRIDHLSQKHSLNYNRLFIRFQKTRWGSCSSRKNISLNWKLITAPEYVIDYVILHELLHTKIPNHSHRFWVYLRSLCPECRRARGWLQENVP